VSVNIVQEDGHPYTIFLTLIVANDFIFGALFCVAEPWIVAWRRGRGEAERGTGGERRRARIRWTPSRRRAKSQFILMLNLILVRSQS
jgi:hypothetical protein